MSPRPDGRGATDLGEVASRPSAVVLVAGNLVPLGAVLGGVMSMGDVFVAYWLESVVIWLATILKVSTARGRPEGWDDSGTPLTVEARSAGLVPRPLLAAAFALHHGAALAFQGFFLMLLVFVEGDLHPQVWALTGAALASGYVVSLWLDWFRAGERWVVPPSALGWQPYPRMLVLYVALPLASLILVRMLERGAPTDHVLVQVGPVAVLVVAKTALDLWFHLRARRQAAGLSHPVEGVTRSPSGARQE